MAGAEGEPEPGGDMLTLGGERQAALLRTHAGNLRTGRPSSPGTARTLLDALTGRP